MSYVPWIKLKKCGMTVGAKMVAFGEFERRIHSHNPTKTLTKTRIFDPKRMNLRTFSKNIASMYCVQRDKSWWPIQGESPTESGEKTLGKK